VRSGLGRHAAYFNTNACIAAVLLGAVGRLELEGRVEGARRVRDLLAAPLSGAADVFFWGALRPACLTLAVAGVLAGQAGLGLVAAFLAFNVPLAVVRWRGFRRAAAAGEQLPQQLDSVRPPHSWGGRLRTFVAAVCGVLLSWSVLDAWRHELRAVFLVGATVLVGYYAGRRQVSPGIAFLLLVGLGTVVQRLDLSTMWSR
ncbi:MAG: PTS system mannose/fructose/sorbose family transporter subunit IID, partial [Candidatus Krumholzibacteriia bacterium]